MSLLLTPRLRDWAIKLNWVDEVGGRKIHVNLFEWEGLQCWFQRWRLLALFVGTMISPKFLGRRGVDCWFVGWASGYCRHWDFG